MIIRSVTVSFGIVKLAVWDVLQVNKQFGQIALDVLKDGLRRVMRGMKRRTLLSGSKSESSSSSSWMRVFGFVAFAFRLLYRVRREGSIDEFQIQNRSSNLLE